ncbi:cell division-specific peptidoglycan biosynthesis regulator FtsW [Alteribacillus persepolensis]|uniref:Probable peptidoglycan glycosyltransferase FtsW n=1 Tax=Alteribacillus persepolensis TaxID=568899 RepID=A0A1G8G403_9BACI|nr:putative lipid II flippase FtsW [Alteribacillus persepolensis]SDH89051.1 cell division-specific peptidoglycan biosynthesis regulator FtsW [Alteribacillus persepolensis]
MSRILQRYDWVLLGAVFALMMFGLVMIYSASFPLGIDMAEDPFYFVKRQLIWITIGLFVFFILLHFPYRLYQKFIPLIVTVSILSLILVVLIGTNVNGSQRWISIGPLSVQPSEFVKIAVILYLAYVYSKKQKYINQFIKGVLPPLIIVVFMFTLIMLQPDLGTATTILLVGGTVVFLSGARWRHLVTLGALATLAVSWLAFTAPYRMQRLVAFRDPFEYEMQGSGHQLIQSYIAMAHGGVTGTGLGQSVQKMHFLPEPHTDFIFAVIAEELGIFGMLFILVCYFLIAYRGVVAGLKCKQLFGRLLAFGIVFFLLFQTIFNLAAVSGLMPITGITLPLVSYGGSSLLVSLIALAILGNIAKEAKQQDIKHHSSVGADKTFQA